MNLFDLTLLLSLVSAALWGYRAGLAARVLSWAGLIVGLLVGLIAVPWFLDRTGDTSRWVVLVVTAICVGVPALIGELEGFALGRKLAPHRAPETRIDRALGAVAGVLGVLAVIWLVLPLAYATDGWTNQWVSGSALASVMRDRLPDPPNLEEALRPLVGAETFPRVFEALQPPVTIDPPAASGLDTATSRRVAASVVEIEGDACGLTRSGSGFVVADQLVVTNAHVVAGESSTTVIRDDGRRLSAVVVTFDPARDLAVLSVRGLARPALPLAASVRGDIGGVFGHPLGGPLRIAPFAINRAVTAVGRDIYDRATVRREVLELAASLKPGDSGSALIDRRGDVVGVAFAISSTDSRAAYALATSELQAVLALPRAGAVRTGGCVD
jgi:S1-C subfamily serine protease